MGSSFFGINIGQSGLYTAQTNLNITSHNIANADTDGYSRQYAVQSATNPLYAGTRGMIGTGSEVTNVEQYHDDYLDEKYWDVSNELGEYTVKNEILSQLELVLNEPSDTGYSTFFNDIFESLSTLSKDPSDTTARSAYVDSLEAFTAYINDVGEQLTDLQQEANFGIAGCVDEINYYAQQLASLNGQIANLELTGNEANDLRDERVRLIDSLSEVINVDATEYTDINGRSTYRVTINGQILVDDTNANYLEIQTRETLENPEDAVDMYDIYWSNGNELYLNQDNLSGEIKGYIDLRDGNNGENFTGTVLSGQGTSQLVVENPSRTDLPQEGEVNIGGTLMRYNSYSYDQATDQITFDFGVPASVDGENATAEDVYGEDFTGTITWVSAEQVTITNTGDQDLPSAGTINLGGTTVTYTGYTKDATAPYTITLDVVTPSDADGENVRIGEDMDYKGVPYYISQLNEFVRTLAEEFNAMNMSGNGGTGEPIFTYEGYDGSADLDGSDSTALEAITIYNFQVNEDLLDDISLIEASTEANAGESANDLILDMIEKRHDDTMFDRGEPDNFMEALIGELGVDAKSTESLLAGQESMVTLVDNQRISVSGVDINEESTNLVKYQQAYNLAAKIISVMDEIYDVTINSMGA